MKRLLLAAGAVAGLSAVAAAFIWLDAETVIDRRFPLPSMTAQAVSDAKSVRRGAHLVAIAGCSDCHGGDLEGRPNGAHTVLPVWSANLRRIPHTDEELERALRFGIKPDSTSTWIMPAMDYTFMSEDDVVGILSFLRTLKPLGAASPRPRFDLRARYAIAADDIRPVAERVLDAPSSLDLGPRYDGGRYLARIVCADCHGTDSAGSPTAPDLRIVRAFSRTGFFSVLHGGGPHRRCGALYDYETDALYDYLFARAKALSPR